MNSLPDLNNGHATGQDLSSEALFQRRNRRIPSLKPKIKQDLSQLALKDQAKSFNLRRVPFENNDQDCNLMIHNKNEGLSSMMAGQLKPEAALIRERDQQPQQEILSPSRLYKGSSQGEQNAESETANATMVKNNLWSAGQEYRKGLLTPIGLTEQDKFRHASVSFAFRSRTPQKPQSELDGVPLKRRTFASVMGQDIEDSVCSFQSSMQGGPRVPSISPAEPLNSTQLMRTIKKQFKIQQQETLADDEPLKSSIIGKFKNYFSSKFNLKQEPSKLAPPVEETVEVKSQKESASPSSVKRLRALRKSAISQLSEQIESQPDKAVDEPKAQINTQVQQELQISISPLIDSSMTDDGLLKKPSTTPIKEVKPKRQWIIPRKSRFLRIFSTIVWASAFLECMYVPMEFAFRELERTIHYSTPIFALDLLLKCRTSFKDPETGSEINQASRIFKRYLKSTGFFIDLLSTVPIKLIASTMMAPEQATLFKLILIVKALREWTSFKIVAEQYKLVLRLANLFVALIVYIHITACLLYFIADLDRKWVPNMERFTREDAPDYYSESVLTRYLASLYMSIMVLSGNEINPESDLHIAVASLLTVVGALMIANVFGTMAVVFTAMNRKSQKMQDQLDLANAAMGNMKLPTFLKENVEHFMLQTQNNLDTQKELDSFMAMISPSLRNQVTKYIFMGAVKSNPIFAASSDQLDFLIKDVSTLLFMPEDTIVHQGEQGLALFLIAKGDCQVWVNNFRREPTFVKSLGQGEYFGEVSLLTDQPRTATVRSSNYCTLASLDKRVFFSLCSNFPDVLISMKRHASEYSDPWKQFKEDLLRKVDYFSSGSSDLLNELQYHMVEETFESGAQIVQDQEKSQSIIFVVEGVIQASVADAKGNDYPLAQLTQGDLLGQYSMLFDQSVNFDAKAKTRVRILSLNRKVLEEHRDILESIDLAVERGEDLVSENGLPFLDFKQFSKTMSIKRVKHRIVFRLLQLVRTKKIKALEKWIAQFDVFDGVSQGSDARDPSYDIDPTKNAPQKKMGGSKRSSISPFFASKRGKPSLPTRLSRRGNLKGDALEMLQYQLDKMKEVFEHTQQRIQQPGFVSEGSESSSSLTSSIHKRSSVLGASIRHLNNMMVQQSSSSLAISAALSKGPSLDKRNSTSTNHRRSKASGHYQQQSPGVQKSPLKFCRQQTIEMSESSSSDSDSQREDRPPCQPLSLVNPIIVLTERSVEESVNNGPRTMTTSKSRGQPDPITFDNQLPISPAMRKTNRRPREGTPSFVPSFYQRESPPRKCSKQQLSTRLEAARTMAKLQQ